MERKNPPDTFSSLRAFYADSNSSNHCGNGNSGLRAVLHKTLYMKSAFAFYIRSMTEIESDERT